MVKWQGWPDSHNTWELERNLTNCKLLVQEYHQKHPEKRGPDPQGKKNNRKKDRKSQPVTSPNQPKVRIAVVRQQEGPYQGRSSPRPALSFDPALSAQRDRDEHTNALAPQPLEALPCSAQAAPPAELSLDASDASPAEPFPTPYQTQKGYTPPSPRYNQHTAPTLC